MEEIATAPDVALYERDFYSWTQRQAALMRAGRLAEIDLPNLVKEIESLGLPLRMCPKTCPFSLEQVEDHDFWPEDAP